MPKQKNENPSDVVSITIKGDLYLEHECCSSHQHPPSRAALVVRQVRNMDTAVVLLIEIPISRSLLMTVQQNLFLIRCITY